MWSRSFSIAAALLVSLTSVASLSADEEQKPIRALMITGGCCHDYDMQKHLIAEGLNMRVKTPIEWTIHHYRGTPGKKPREDQRIPIYNEQGWADDFDIVIHNECFAHERDPEWIEKIIKPHREGVPAIVVHCTMHSYGFGKVQPWVEFLGVSSPRHGAKYSFLVEPVAKDSPIAKAFGDGWQTPQGELYHINEVTESATPIAHAKRQGKGKETYDVCYWTNQYGKGRVFGTTVGHHNETVEDPVYQDALARGFLWALDRFDEKLINSDVEQDVYKAAVEKARIKAAKEEHEKNKPAGEPTKAASKAGGKAGSGTASLTQGKQASASSEEAAKNNLAADAVDGDLSTRWCANGDRQGEWLQVDLGEPQKLQAVRILWEFPQSVYRYKVLGSNNGTDWNTIIDASDASQTNGVATHEFPPTDARYLRVEFLGNDEKKWGSLWELEAYDGKLPQLDEAFAEQAETSPLLRDVKAPESFDVSIFAAPPEVNYPVCIHTTPDGVVFVGVDENGSLGKKDGFGKVLRCVDTNGDGAADDIKVFAEMRHPRGLHFENGNLWVLHPPYLTRFRATDGDGVSDESQVLLEGISTEKHVFGRGADHTTNGIEIGIDGWIYIAVGDFGYLKATDVDGNEHQLLGGGVVRVRPDGRELEVYAYGTRNICDVAIDPLLNIFARDNTNDGGGWDIRLSYIPQTAQMGYPSLYKRFGDEIIQPLGDYGGGSGTGALYLSEPSLPAPYHDALLTADWGRNQVYYQPLEANGASFTAGNETFVSIPRPTDMDVDANGRLYIASWKDGKFKYKGEDVGFVARLTPKDFAPSPTPDVTQRQDDELLKQLESPSAVMRQAAQWEIVRRADKTNFRPELKRIAQSSADLPVRVAALFTLKEAYGAEANPMLAEFASDATIREWALRALTDRKTQLVNLPADFNVSADVIVAALDDENPRVRAQAAVSLGRLGRVEYADKLLPLTIDDDPIVAHVAVKALVALEAAEACLAVIGEEDSPLARGGLRTLREIHSEAAVTGLIDKLATVKSRELRHEVLSTLIRLYYQEGEWPGDWWGTRPDTRGPYYRRGKWAQTERIESVIAEVLATADEAAAKHIREQLEKHLVESENLNSAVTTAGSERAEMIDIAKLLESQQNVPGSIGTLSVEQATKQTMAAKGEAKVGEQIFNRQGCIQCHSVSPLAPPVGPQLLDIGKRYSRLELLQSILQPSAKIAQGFDTTAIIMLDGKQHVGVVTVEGAEDLTLLDANGKSIVIIKDDIDERVKIETSVMPEGLVHPLTPEQLAGLLDYLETLKSE